MCGGAWQAHRLLVQSGAGSAFSGRVVGGAWTDADRKLLLTATIVVDVQAFLGLLLWLLEQRWAAADPARSWENPVIMLLALWLVHVGASRAKKAADADKWRAAGNWLLAAALLVALGIARVTLF